MLIEQIQNKLKGAQILVVDDTPANIDLLYTMLTDQGYNIAVAPSGEIALRIVGELKPDLILLDVMMPKLDGFATCRLLKEMQCCRDIPVIFITAKSAFEDMLEGFEAGAVDYITKPIKEKEVLARVKTHLQLRIITQQQESLLEMVQDYELRNRSIINSFFDPLITICPPGIVESVNPAALNLFGFSAKEIIGKPFHQLLAEKDQGIYQDCFNGGSNLDAIELQNKEVLVKHKSLAAIPIDLKIKQLSLKYPLFIALMHDLSKHKKTLSALKKESNLDQLTNIANRRCFDNFFEQAWIQAKNMQGSLAVILLDIDYFKLYNDNYGHQAGDLCLQEVAQALEQCVTRETDLVARYGGEEFVVVMPNTDLTEALVIAETIRQNIINLKLPHHYSSVLSSSKIVTVSLGVAAIKPAKNQLASELFKQADEAMYQAKDKGRNGIQFYQQD